MKRFIIFLTLGILFIGGIIYFAFSSSKTMSITYIKFKINPSFIIGLDDKDVVKIYNPMNDDAKLFNLVMFNNKPIENAMNTILLKLDENNYLEDKQIDITVISKNVDKINYYYNKLTNVINNYNNEIVLNNKMASVDELYAYTNEIAYDVKSSLNNDNLLEVVNNIDNQISEYVNEQLRLLNTKKLNDEMKLELFKEKELEGYFNNYDLTTYHDTTNNIRVIDGKYSISFNDDLTYNISLDLTIEYSHFINENDKQYTILEDYNFIYENNEIKNLKTVFYKY